MDEDQTVGRDPFAWATRMDLAELAEGWPPVRAGRRQVPAATDSTRLRKQTQRPRSSRLRPVS
ncbi:MAG: hypothetical protein KC486_26400 [Myxococcales bacterium]|nr:hypothetical protein [Myxococcales bacterium]